MPRAGGAHRTARVRVECVCAAGVVRGAPADSDAFDLIWQFLQTRGEAAPNRSSSTPLAARVRRLLFETLWNDSAVARSCRQGHINNPGPGHAAMSIGMPALPRALRFAPDGSNCHAHASELGQALFPPGLRHRYYDHGAASRPTAARRESAPRVDVLRAVLDVQAERLCRCGERKLAQLVGLALAQQEKSLPASSSATGASTRDEDEDKEGERADGLLGKCAAAAGGAGGGGAHGVYTREARWVLGAEHEHCEAACERSSGGWPGGLECAQPELLLASASREQAQGAALRTAGMQCSEWRAWPGLRAVHGGVSQCMSRKCCAGRCAGACTFGPNATCRS